MRRFITVSHTGDTSGEWHLNDLTAGAGRIDVLCRNIQAAFFLSHGLREDVEFYAVFTRSPVRQKTVRIQGAAIQMLNPDERSTAARIQQALKASWSVPDWKDVQRGLSVAAFGLEELLSDLAGKGTFVLLDPEGTAVDGWVPPADPIFLLSDHTTFTPGEYRAIEAAMGDGGQSGQRVSLGPQWYHGNHAIAVVQWTMDKHHPVVSSDARTRGKA